MQYRKTGRISGKSRIQKPKIIKTKTNRDKAEIVVVTQRGVVYYFSINWLTHKSAQNKDQCSDGEQTGRLEYKYTRKLNTLQGSLGVRTD